MTKDLNTKVFAQAQEELEKEFFGGNIYSYSHKFPSIFITNKKEDEQNSYELESFINYTQLIHNISDKCGSDLALLFAEVCNVYNINNDVINEKSFKDKVIIDFCTETLAHLSLAMNQSEKLLDLLNSFDKKEEMCLELHGKSYCFIIVMLNNLFHYYTTIVSFIVKKRYLNIEFINSISERMSFIISEEFETMRRIFKVIECYKEAESTKTFH